MYPAHGLQLFPPFPREDRVFVAMPFDTRFEPRWRNVIEPGIKDAGLSAFRVDIPKTSTSIPADIIRGIAQSRVIFADVTAVDGHRNGNVMYEVGIAHSSRQPEEVLLFRSDNERLLFDVSTIRVNPYDPDGRTAEARETVGGAVRAALLEIQIVKSQAVESAARALDVPAIQILFAVIVEGHTSHPEMRTVGQILGNAHRVQVIGRLLELGLIETSPSESAAAMSVKEDLTVFLRSHIEYRPTDFGEAVLNYFIKRNIAAFATALEDSGGADTA